MINNSYVQEKINDIFKRLFQIDLITINEEMYGKNLLGDVFRFEPIDLLCLYMEIENVFSISIPEEYIAENKFNTINNIIEIASVQLGYR